MINMKLFHKKCPAIPPRNVALPERIAKQQKLFLRSYAKGKDKWDMGKACKAAKVKRTTVVVWMHRYPQFAEIMFEVNEERKDFGETRLVELMKERGMPGVTATIFFNKTINRDRGYDESPMININNSLNAVLDKDQIDKMVQLKNPEPKRITNAIVEDA